MEPPTLPTHIRGNSVMPLNINILNRVTKPCNVSINSTHICMTKVAAKMLTI